MAACGDCDYDYDDEEDRGNQGCFSAAFRGTDTVGSGASVMT